MAWNYRGYGATPGSPTPYNIKTDGESMIKFMLDYLGLQGNFGVYGRSMGGVVATHLASKFPDKIKLLLADRTFGNLKTVAKRKFLGAGSSLLYNVISVKWETDNDINFH